MKDYSLRFFFVFIFVLCLSGSAFGSRIVKEGYFVFDKEKTSLQLFRKHLDLTLDHINDSGYEVYGPNGLGVWLNDLGVKHIDINDQLDKAATNYATPEEINNELRRLANTYPHIAKLVSIGKSAAGRDLLFMKISDNPEIDEVEPEFKYIGNMHGDEIANREVLLKFIEFLLSEYNKNEEVTTLIDNAEVWIMVSMNPDGAANKRRGNQNWVDLNRDFPDFTTSDNVNTGDGRAVETKAVMNFQKERQFALSANFHGGAVCVNYPWDTTPSRPPLMDYIIELSREYASKVPEMANSYQFSGGITNGYDWYEVDGGMQDWSFYWHGDMQLTVEMHGSKWPSYKLVEEYYKANRSSLLTFARRILQGGGFNFNDTSVSGRVTIFRMEDVNKFTKLDLGNYSFKGGEFYKVLPPGRYEFMIETAQRGNHHIEVDVDPTRVIENGNFVMIN